jgi:bacteriorhodopsin
VLPRLVDPARRVDLQEVGVSHVDYEMCSDPDHGDIIYSIMLCIQVCMVAVKIVAKVTLRSHFRWGKHKVGKTGSM